MKEKIDWYQEVLDLEPGSKVFFPLAKLLAQNNDYERAVETLQHGLERHPEYIEARLYLVDILHKNPSISNHQDKLKHQLSILTPLLARYAGFWKAWEDNTKTSEQGDTKLAIAFMGAIFQDKNLSIAEIFSKGLQAVIDNTEKDSNPSGGGSKEKITTSTTPDNTENVANEADVTQSAIAQSKPKISLRVEQFRKSPQENIDNTNNTLADDALLDEDEEGEERFSLRTRSMAEVLAEQGDYAGALEIYQELVDNSTSDKEKEDLKYRMGTLSAHLGNIQDQEKTVENDANNAPGKERILSVLETLAERLESRVQS